MFEINCTTSFHADDGSKTKDDYVRQWTGLEKEHVVEHFEMAFNRAMMKMNKMAAEVNRGRAPKPTTTLPVEMRMDIMITEDGAKYIRASYEWPNVGEEQQALLLGMLNGELSMMPDDIRGAEKRGGKKK